MITCPRCGAANPNGTRFCNECGLGLESADAGTRVASAVADPRGPTEGETPPMANPRPGGPAAVVGRDPEMPIVEAESDEERRTPPPVRPSGSDGGGSGASGILKVLGALLLAAALVGVGWAVGSSTQPAAAPTAVPTATPTFSPQSALQATIQADSRIQSKLTLAVGPEGTSHPVPWGGNVTFAPGSVTSPVSATIERLPDAAGDTFLPAPGRVFQVQAIQTDTQQPVPNFSGPVTLSGVGTQCLIHQGNQEFEPIVSQRQGNQLECQIPRPGILAMLRQ